MKRFALDVAPDVTSGRKRNLVKQPQKQSRNLVLNEEMPSEVIETINDPGRFSPMLAGASCIRSAGARAKLVVRAAGEDIEVEAPTELLDHVFRRCDGTHTIHEVLSSVEDASLRGELAKFLEFLISEGALIDANLASAHAARYAFQFSPFGLAAPPRVTGQICRRFLWNKKNAPRSAPKGTAKIYRAPLEALFAARVTSYTFDDKTIAVAALHQLLWSLAGVVRVKHPRVGHVTPQRTIASAGGMHLLEVFVVLLRKVGGYVPGVYRVQYPDQRALRLQHVSSDHNQIGLAFGKPWELTYATGAVFVVADPVVAAMRYRSRSLQYLFMEAGAALHNGALSADGLNLGYATIGGYYERPISRMCMLDRQLLLGSAIFGAKPTQQQVALIAKSPDIDFAWVNGDSARYSMGFHLARAKVITDDDDRPHTWGRGTDPWLAMRKAIGEAIEREGFREPREIVQGTLGNTQGAQDPRNFVRYDDSQYQLPGFPYTPFSPKISYPWSKAIDLASGKAVRVLAELVFSRTSLAAVGHHTPQPYTQVTSSGCAASTTPEGATLSALLEVIERDGFMRHWLMQKPGLVISSDQWPKEISRRIQALQTIGCRVAVQLLPVPWAHVALVSVQHDQQHFTTMGTAASFDFRSAVNNSLDEVEARVYAWLHGHIPSISRIDEVMSTEHHFELYGLKRYFKRADQVLFPQGVPNSSTRWPLSFRDTSLTALIERFIASDLHPVAADITPKQCYVDQGRTRISVVKALVPGLLPISFGYQREPLGMVPRVHSGSKFPHPFP
jgi:ribosomal protein S12 methylthiotransferase accessory factor